MVTPHGKVLRVDRDLPQKTDLRIILTIPQENSVFFSGPMQQAHCSIHYGKLRGDCPRAAGDEEGFRFWWERLEAVTRGYARVLMLGDSMGATAALLFSPLATAVHAFTPQARC